MKINIKKVYRLSEALRIYEKIKNARGDKIILDFSDSLYNGKKTPQPIPYNFEGTIAYIELKTDNYYKLKGEKWL